VLRAMMESRARGANRVADLNRATSVIGLAPCRSDRYAIRAMGIVAASVGRKKGNHD
jgi:hypothetical protein